MSIKVIDFERAPLAQGAYYGGNAGAKEGIMYDDAVWMIKYPKTTRDLINPQISYTTSPLSEYLGSKIYELLGLPVHEVVLGVRKNKIVVACRDFTFSRDTFKQLIAFHNLKNTYMSSDLEEYTGTGSETLIDEVLATIEGLDTLKNIPGVLECFWDMFVIDAFIGNNDRNNGNWGLIRTHTLDGKVTMELAPVYDNGNAFFNKRSLKQMESRVENPTLMEDDAYLTPVSVYKYTGLDNEGHRIKPFKFIEESEDEQVLNATKRFLERVDIAEIEALIKEIPENVGTLAIMPEIQKKFYLQLLQLRIERFKAIIERSQS